MRNRRVTVQWYDDEFEAHFLDMPVPITYSRKDINSAVDAELFDSGVADYRWGVTDDITHVLVNKITDLLEKENLRYRIIESFNDVFSFELTDYYRGYVYFKVDLVEFTISQSYIAGIGHVTDQEEQNADKVSAGLRKIIEREIHDLYNVNNRPTWVMTILDSTHAIRGYYYLDASDQSIYGTGSNPTSALDSFRQALVDSGSSAGNTPGEKKKNFSGMIDRAAVVSSKNKAMFMLKGKNIIFTVNTNDYDFANLIRPGDKVKFSANVVKGKAIGNVSDFEDRSLR